ncbi:PREDICTED: thioredoxin domain-containing protein 6 [Miniopterus natalensis]|uniref:thioredoxin domain-containing protein 6 n=1 Tax=Miniopterus natalensis TaxID=291302 RepID=UPI0007A6D071|nr:PREDICTED: thioredoxin domain-containing protein 6 [Miniopterus natalensis]
MTTAGSLETGLETFAALWKLCNYREIVRGGPTSQEYIEHRFADLRSALLSCGEAGVGRPAPAVQGFCPCGAMGSKRKDAALQVNISTQELWEEMLSSKGLTVVDVYQGWCGPCKPVVSLFQKMRIMVGLDLLHFALAEADCLDALEKYRGRCEPTFLFYAGGKLVAVVRGANAPLLQKTILDQLEAERKVLAEGRERKAETGNFPARKTITSAGASSRENELSALLPCTIKDEALSEEEERFSHERDRGEDEGAVLSEKTCTLAIIKPDAVVHGKTDEIIMKIQEAGFDILTREERTMTEAEMRLFYQHRAGEEAFEKLVHHMCSGPSHLLILTRTEDTEDVVTAWRTLMGPCDPNVARREQPDSLRAQYGMEIPFNAVHGSRDREAASRELALLFPSFKFSGQAPEATLDPTFWENRAGSLPPNLGEKPKESRVHGTYPSTQVGEPDLALLLLPRSAFLVGA